MQKDPARHLRNANAHGVPPMLLRQDMLVNAQQDPRVQERCEESLFDLVVLRGRSFELAT